MFVACMVGQDRQALCLVETHPGHLPGGLWDNIPLRMGGAGEAVS